MTAHAVLSLLAALSLLSPISVESAQEEERNGLVSSVIAMMREQIERAPIGGSAELLAAISADAGLEAAETRHRLLALIDSLDAARIGKTEAWQELTRSGQPKIEPKKADRFLKSLVTESRKILKKEGADYSLDHKLNEASAKAKLTADEGREFLERLLGSPSAADSWKLPARFGLRVTVEMPRFAWGYTALGSTETERRKNLAESISQKLQNPDNKFAQFFHSNDAADIADRLMTITSRISQALVLDLPGATRIKWAIDTPSPTLQPEYELAIEPIFGIDRILPEADGSRAGHWRLRLWGPADLVHIETGRRLFRDSVTLAQNHEPGNEEEMIDQFFAGFAEVVRLQLEELLAGNR